VTLAETRETTACAELKFLADLSKPLVYVPSKGGGDQTEHQGNFRTHSVEVHDARRALPATDLDREGFVLLEQPSAVDDFYDDDALQNTYHGELIALIKATTGAQRVEVFDDTRRSASIATQQARGIREPANIVHNDYTAASGPRRLRDFFAGAPEEAEALRQRRFAIINAWRPINGPVYDQPLVLCDASTLADGDLVAMERRAEERIGELQVALFNPGQRWYYYPRMRPEEILLFKTYDSAEDGRARFTPHSSFADPAAPPDAPARESLETRCLVFF
jgi:hypothetical protein